MSKNIYVSRSFVEFGAFKVDEILDFKKRGIILDSDYLRLESNSHWVPASDWTGESAPPAPAAVEEAPAKPKAAPKKRSAKKAA